VPTVIPIRRLPPVYSRIGWSAFTRAAFSLQRWAAQRSDALAAMYPHHDILFTDSGTSALAMALTAALRARPGAVALPAYGCPDLGTAALAARARIMLYDLDPHTLAPDMDSLLAAVRGGATVVVAAHFFGRLADIPAIQERVAPLGAVVVEDAAQHAGGSLRGGRGGSFGDYAILSFGRGKGLNAGGGGALLRPRTSVLDWPAEPEAPTTGHAISGLVSAVVAEVLSRPAMYWLPAALPQLKLGETVYHAPRPPRTMAAPNHTLLNWALQHEPAELERRREHEAWYADALSAFATLMLSTPPESMHSGALRFPVRVLPESVVPLRQFGVARSYPRLLSDYPAIATACLRPTGALLGAAALARELHTLPTHSLVTHEDREAIVRHLQHVNGGAP
jgi:perosamine synthetase